MRQRLVRSVLTLSVLAAMGLAGCTTGGGGRSEITITHLHGLGYGADGKQLYVPAHQGFVVFTGGNWQVPDLPKHDYMGYSPTDNGFYSSGHPAPGSGLPNPLGLVKSTDAGKSITTLGFQGEIDFHLMGAGYQSHAVYIVLPAKAPSLGPGLHYSLDDGKTWRQGGLQGITSLPIQVAVHPTKVGVVALATEHGLFLSTDHGDRFERIGAQSPVTAAAFSPDGNQLLFGFTQLSAYDLAGKQVRPYKTPAVTEKEPIGYIAVNPAQPKELAMGTFGRDIHRSTDGGQTWTQIATQGKGLSSGK